MNMNLSKLWEIMENRGVWCSTAHEVTKSWTQLSNCTTSVCMSKRLSQFSLPSPSHTVSTVCSVCLYLYSCPTNRFISTIFLHSMLLSRFSHVRLFETPWTAACQASLSFTISCSLLKLMSIELVMSSSHLILCPPLLLLPSIFPSIRVFSNEWALCIRWPKYWSFSFSISPSNGYSELISFRIDWFHLAG